MLLGLTKVVKWITVTNNKLFFPYACLKLKNPRSSKKLIHKHSFLPIFLFLEVVWYTENVHILPGERQSTPMGEGNEELDKGRSHSSR